MSMRTTPVSKCLDKKLLIMGYEVVDLMTIFLLLSVLNLTLGQTGQRLLLVWLPSITFALLLRFGKRGKPDNYLLHLAQYTLSPKKISAFYTASNWKAPHEEKAI